MKFLRRNKKPRPEAHAGCVNHHRTDRFDDAERWMAVDRVASAAPLRYR